MRSLILYGKVSLSQIRPFNMYKVRNEKTLYVNRSLNLHMVGQQARILESASPKRISWPVFWTWPARPRRCSLQLKIRLKQMSHATSTSHTKFRPGRQSMNLVFSLEEGWDN